MDRLEDPRRKKITIFERCDIGLNFLYLYLCYTMQSANTKPSLAHHTTTVGNKGGVVAAQESSRVPTRAAQQTIINIGMIDDLKVSVIKRNSRMAKSTSLKLRIKYR